MSEKMSEKWIDLSGKVAIVTGGAMGIGEAIVKLSLIHICKWRIVTLHQDIYGSAEHSNEPEITNLRYQLTPIFEQNNIDAVLTGHDHAYSRSKMLLGGTKTNDYTDDELSLIHILETEEIT